MGRRQKIKAYPSEFSNLPEDREAGKGALDLPVPACR